MREDDLNVHVFRKRNSFSPKSGRWFFFWLWLLEDLSIGRILNEKKYGGTELISEKAEAL